MYALGIATRGFLGCETDFPLALATQGYICLDVQISDTGGGGHGGKTVKRHGREYDYELESRLDDQDLVDLTILLIKTGIIDE